MNPVLNGLGLLFTLPQMGTRVNRYNNAGSIGRWRAISIAARSCRRAATTMRACAGPSDASGALSRVEGEMTAFQNRSALIWSDWGFDRSSSPRDGRGGQEDESAAGPGGHGFVYRLQLELKVKKWQYKSAAAGARLIVARISPSRRCWSLLTADGVGGSLQAAQTPSACECIGEVLQSCSEASALNCGASTRARGLQPSCVAVMVTE